MDYQKFIEELPTYYQDWGQPSIRPRSDDFQQALSQIQGMTTANVMQLLNVAVGCLEAGEVYCEIGTYQGSTLVGALLHHPTALSYAVDNFSEYDVLGENLDKLQENLVQVGLQDQVVFCNQDFEEFFADLHQMGLEDKIGVYFYDGAHDYRSQLLGLLLVRPFLADQALIVIDDSNWGTVRQAVQDFVVTHPQCQPLLELSTPIARHPTFWNGLYLLSWDVNRQETAAELPERRYPEVIRAIYELQMMEQRDLPTQLFEEIKTLQQQRRFAEAEQKYPLLLLWKGQDPDVLLQLSRLYYEMGRYQEASQSIVQVLNLAPDWAIAHYTLGLISQASGNATLAIAAYQEAIRLGLEELDGYDRLGQLFRHQQDYRQAEAVYRQAIQQFPTVPGLYFALIMLLREADQMPAAIALIDQAVQQFPQDYTFQFLQSLMLPMIYQTAEEIQQYRQRYTEGLQRLTQQVTLDTVQKRRNALLATRSLTNFYLAYHAQNDCDLQLQYGQLLQRIMAANYPQWAEAPAMPPLGPNGKIRLGYVSAYLHSYSGTLWLTGWLRYCDRQGFELYCYYTGNQPDAVTEQFRSWSDAFHHIPHNLEAVCQQIRADQLHCLIFPEIGMDPQTLQMAALKLAPVVCTAWGHPDTSGLSTVDYFLSSELMESELADAHYREQLIRLPNIGVAYPRPVLPPLTRQRSDYGLREDAVVYLCCQAPFKYLPQHDDLLVEIARQVPQAQFVFIRANILRPRLHQAFAKAGLDLDQFCVFLPVQARNPYLMLNLLSDVYLDTVGFTGGNTTLDAIACHLPVVTYPNELMRGRLSYSMLKRIGVTETIASSEADYVAIAVRLGLDSSWRAQVASQLAAHCEVLYDDQACVKALEAVIRQIICK